MSFRSIMLRIYPAILKRIHSWGLLLLLLFLYVSAFGIRSEAVLSLISKIGILSFHVFLGFILILVIVILGYDLILGILTVQKKTNSQRGIRRFLGNLKNADNRTLINYLFYLFLFLISGFGFLLYLIKTYSLNSLVFNQVVIAIVHESMGWLFLSILLVKYYLVIIKWFSEFKRYLREF